MTRRWRSRWTRGVEAVIDVGAVVFLLMFAAVSLVFMAIAPAIPVITILLIVYWLFW